MSVDEVKAAADRVKECTEQAARHYQREIPFLDVRFDLTGATGGMFCWERDRATGKEAGYFRLNKILLKENLQEYLAQIIPHEVAHYVVHLIAPRSAKAHGREWQSVMTTCFKIKADRCHRMDTATSKKAPFIYRCGCVGKEFRITTRTHNAIVRGRGRICRRCSGKLVFLRFEERVSERPRIQSLFVSTGGAEITKDLLQRIKGILDDHNVDGVVADALMRDDRQLDSLRRTVNVDQTQFRVHADERTLPGGLTHAILFEGDGSLNDRQLRAAKALSARGVKVRLVKSQI